MKNNWKEDFDNKFVNTLYSTQSDVQVDEWKLIDYGNGEHKIGHYYGPKEIKNFIESLLAEQKKELMEEVKEELRTWINNNNVDFNGTDVTYTAELANYVDNKLKHHD